MSCEEILFSDQTCDLAFLRKNSSSNIKFASDSEIFARLLDSSENPTVFIRASLFTGKIKSLVQEKNCRIYEYSNIQEIQDLPPFQNPARSGRISRKSGGHTNLQSSYLQKSLAELSPTFSLLSGTSKSMQRLRKEIIQVSKSDVSVLLLGETGTGKTTVARAIHELSGRRKMPFRDCVLSNSNETLIESKLFGVTKGAFTGAVESKGVFEEADGGTLFLDEIGEIEANIQTKLLQVLSEKVISRVGSNKEIPVDARMIFATNANIEKKIREGTFREDLFYRINDLTIKIPPLRDRIEDIPELCRSFLRREKIQKEISDSTIRFLQTFPWKGNIRQLEKVLRAAALVYSTGDIIEPGDIRI